MSRPLVEESEYAKRPLQRWTIQQAMEFAAAAEPTVSACGFLLSLYGSTMRRGHGRDLDVILVPKCSIAHPDDVLRAICGRFSAVLVGTQERSMFADKCALLHLPDGRLLDIQVRMGDPRKADEHAHLYGYY
jgi:hypothetical protein